MMRVVLLVGVSLALVGCGATPTTSSRSEADRKAQVAREETKQAVQKKLDQFDQQLQQWMAKIATATGDAKAKMVKAYEEAKTHREEYAKKLDELGQSTADAWEKLKAGLEKAGEQTAEAFKQAANEFK